ncbi:hypothetical protein [Streptomyces murinus]|uniref:hypothetical protein n=1 Tax=Streptomyces murinus TaxID=33900 RepID=UPI002E121F63|nr:hypothetical protein OG516_16120 [Streptomyces murinus]
MRSGVGGAKQSDHVVRGTQFLAGSKRDLVRGEPARRALPLVTDDDPHRGGTQWRGQHPAYVLVLQQRRVDEVQQKGGHFHLKVLDLAVALAHEVTMSRQRTSGNPTRQPE